MIKFAAGDWFTSFPFFPVSHSQSQSYVDVVVVDPTGASMVASAPHILGHVTSHAARLKEVAYASWLSSVLIKGKQLVAQAGRDGKAARSYAKFKPKLLATKYDFFPHWSVYQM
ncbi:unnamed protein product [Calypogeia fissa]